MQRDQALSMLGIAAKAGKIKSGGFSTEKAIKSGQAYLVIISGEASENTKKKFYDMTGFYHVPCYTYADNELLGNSIGKQFRVLLAVTDEKLAKSVEDKLKTSSALVEQITTE